MRVQGAEVRGEGSGMCSPCMSHGAKVKNLIQIRAKLALLNDESTIWSWDVRNSV